MRVKPTYLLGTSIKITTILTTPSPTSIVITIDDPSDVSKVTSAAMAREGDGVYSYVYQSASTDLEGEYVLTISAVSGGYTSVAQDEFILAKQE